MKKKPMILFTTPVLRHPAVGGPYLRIENSIKALSQISDLIIYCRTPISDLEVIYYQQFCQKFYISSTTRFFYRQKERVKNISNRFSKKLFGIALFQTRTDFSEFINLADTIKPDIIWLGYGNISYPLLKLLKHSTKYKVVCDTDSVWSRFVLRGLPFAADENLKKRIKKEGEEKEEEERWGTWLSDITTAVSEVDAEYYRMLAKNSHQVQIFSNVIDLKDYENIPDKPTGYKNPCIYLAGTFGQHSPMEEAARWVIEKILPLVKVQIPDIHFYIIGNGSEKTLRDIRDPSITITGKLPSVLPYLCHADVSVVPLKFESGTRFKILEAGACKIPVVSTTLGAEGIPVIDGTNILIADNPEEFALAIIRIIREPDFAKKIGTNLYSLIEEKYCIPSLVSEASEIIKNLDSE